MSILSTKTKQTLLNERYRPTTLETFVGNKNLKASIQRQLDNNDIQNYLFYGTAGVGKTTLAKIIMNSLDCEYLYINASDERGIDTIRDKVTSFASMASFKPLKVVILDESDFLTINAQASLRNVIETFSRTTRFILTCNYIDKIIEPIQSRCKTFKVEPPTKRETAIHIANICDKEDISYEIKDIGAVVTNSYPDIRKMLNTIQSSSPNKELILDSNLNLNSTYMESIVKELEKSNPKFNTIRQIILDSNVNDFDNLYRYLFDNASRYTQNEGLIAITINEHIYKSNFRVDKEINICSCLSQILNYIKN